MNKSEISTALITKFEEYLQDLIDELNDYGAEDQLWRCPKGISNSAGNLYTHLIGNLNHFIGAIVGNTGYVRNRSLEFSVKNLSRLVILKELEAVRIMIPNTLNQLSNEDYFKIYPFTFGNADFKPTTHEWMLQILAHLAYHVGQINYHRRLLANS